MAIIDEFKSDKNRSLIIQASTKMLLDKYRLSLNAETLINIMNAVISAMSKDAILMNNTIKLMELNTITLAKMKDYIIKNIDRIRNDGFINDNEENIAGAMGAVASMGAVGTVANAANATETASGASTNSDTMSVANAASAATDYKEEYSFNKGDILSNEELLIRVKEYENSRAISATMLASTANAANSANAANIDNTVSGASVANAAQGTTQAANILPEMMEKVLTSINTFINKKTLVINSFSRDWINNPKRNQLSFTVNIDLQSNIIEPLKILFPRYVKDKTPYIVLVITDNHRTFKYNFLYSKSSGKWDIWELMGGDTTDKKSNINNSINLANKTWKIHFLDYLNNELNLGKDDIKVSQINDYHMNYCNNTSMDTNIDNILMPLTQLSPHNLTKDAKRRQSFYEINIDYSNQLEYDDYNLDTVSKYDYILAKTYNNNYVNIKVLEVNNDLGKIIVLNSDGLSKDDLNNSSLLNYGAQYSLILTYYPIRNAI
uniref:Uncharacterized protein n=1 Tax=viral metagenome TaxID=1070528 RepID=A0A6C0K8E0_9ZZZZ